MPNRLQEIKGRLDQHIGQVITVVSQLGRKKVTKRSGVLRETYPSLFVIELDAPASVERVSYSYTDVLTQNINVIFAD